MSTQVNKSGFVDGDDMKRKMTKEILAESFREIAENRPVDKITIQEIVDNCGYFLPAF